LLLLYSMQREGASTQRVPILVTGLHLSNHHEVAAQAIKLG
jgi:hypothetical protein